MALPQQPPFAQKLAIKSRNYKQLVPLASDFNYAEKITTQTVNGIKPPLWIIVFADNATKKHTAKGQSKPYTIQNGQLHPIEGTNSQPADTEPANDVYFILKPGASQSELHYIGKEAVAPDAILFNGKPLIKNIQNVSAPKSFALPGVGRIGMLSTGEKLALGVFGIAGVAGVVAVSQKQS